MRATAAGSLPGTDFRGALGAMAEALPDVTPLPELPARGVGSDMIGRVLGLIDGLAFDLQPAGWRLTSHSDAAHRRARAAWRRDLDDAEELLQDFDGILKVGVAGPWTLAAGVERPAGDRLLADHGARRELSQALADSVATLRADLARRLPRAAGVWVQVDEPALVAVEAGAIPTASGFSKHRRVDAPKLVEGLRGLGGPDSVLHCCAKGAWLEIARRAGFAGVSVDAALIDLDELAQWCDEQRRLVLGVVDTASLRPQGVDELVRAALRVLRQVGTEVYPELLLGTACGLGGWQRDQIGGQLEALTRAAGLVEEQLARG